MAVFLDDIGPMKKACSLLNADDVALQNVGCEPTKNLLLQVLQSAASVAGPHAERLAFYCFTSTVVLYSRALASFSLPSKQGPLLLQPCLLVLLSQQWRSVLPTLWHRAALLIVLFVFAALLPTNSSMPTILPTNSLPRKPAAATLLNLLHFSPTSQP